MKNIYQEVFLPYDTQTPIIQSLISLSPENVFYTKKPGTHCKENCKTEKYEKTCMEKYNERSTMHIDDIFYKCQESFVTTKKYTFEETKRIINIQGTEDIIINYLLNNENKILKRESNINVLHPLLRTYNF